MPSWDPAEAEQVTSEAQLREVVEPPFPEIAEKAVSGIDDVSRRFIERSRLFFVAMADLALKGVPPALAVVVNVEELFVHCGRALLKSGALRPGTWPEGEQPGVMALFESQQALTPRV